MADAIVLDERLTWKEVAAIANGAELALSPEAWQRLSKARAIVDALVAREIRGYGINTGVGALCDVIIDRDDQQSLSRNILLSHSCGIGEPLGKAETRAVMAAQIANFAHGFSGISVEVVEALLALLNADFLPVIPSRGSVGYLTHAAAIGLVLIGEGECRHADELISGREALKRLGLDPVALKAKEGLSLVNGTPCATGLAALTVSRFFHLLDWADAAAAMTYENLGAQAEPFAEMPLSLRHSAGLQQVGRNLRHLIAGSQLLTQSGGSRTQDPLSLRAVPQIHGAVRDVLRQAVDVVDRELSSVTDNPIVTGSPDAPQVHSQAHAVGAGLGLGMDSVATAAAELAAISERRIDRLVNPLVSGLPAFLAAENGVCSGFMIIQYTAAALVAENRRLAAPASLDGGITSALQEDILTHATPAADKALAILDNLQTILAIEVMAAAQAYDQQPQSAAKAVRTAALYARARGEVPFYRDDRPLNGVVAKIRSMMGTTSVGLEGEAS
ncbi:HAL/PAL/TAL family ammonia-lyase [Neorhizobium galegae]|uniref:HAL/PAL/TAL family ammonia-lyase n=1 Tax=Neorhizobium galegae TaxID=399 RepID=UPI00062249F4|nr:histidine ammonia-lyase [Neorhizobium galegae]CDZ60260.1 Histidine ammonia-lyase [Neorhizobium galegae bv. orientalis]KAB1120964.1 histidine ammonia-lyase [Neorhizobium galegae]MCQ1574521.1 histidine ammonia-lyase [Neorhizobium galegae]MCQ1810306.1 histidine ammonia-lyase [Neorhizobium galegae]CDZ64619.1 Histidine ammonia-lyase [Neorhizobium galegae bv. orientalis]